MLSLCFYLLGMLHGYGNDYSICYDIDTVIRNFQKIYEITLLLYMLILLFIILCIKYIMLINLTKCVFLLLTDKKKFKKIYSYLNFVF